MVVLITFIKLIFITHVFSQNIIVYNSSNSGLPDNEISCVTSDRYGVKWIGTLDSGIVKFYNNQWTRYDSANSGLPGNSIRDIVFDRSGIMWAVIRGKGLGRYDGQNWLLYNQTNSPLKNVSSIAVDSNDTKWVVTSGWLAKYDNTNWTLFDSTNGGYYLSYSFAMDFEGDTLWIATGLKGLARYCNGNLNFYNMQNSGMPDNVAICIYIDKSRNKWVGTYFGGAAKFNSAQNIWTNFDLMDSLNLGNNLVPKIIADDSSAYFSCMSTMYRYSNTGFEIIPAGTPTAFEFDRYNNLWIGSYHALSIYNPYGIVSVKNEEEIIPDGCDIIQNYPNPFNNETKIKVTISKSATVSLNIYDMNGRFIKELTNARYNKGSYEFKFNGSYLASGVYFAVLTTDKGIRSHKIVFLK